MKKTNEELDNFEKNKLEKKSIISNNKAITLISLVITIILLIILAGIAINLGLKENGLLDKAKFAKDKYINEQEEEKERLNDLYSEVLVATGENSQITISVKELKELIQEEVMKSTKEPTGIKTDVFIENTISNKSKYDNVTSTSNLFVKKMDKNSKIKEYLSYSEEDGYTVLKSGWYFIKMSTTVESSSPADIYMSVIINANQMNYLRGWTNNGWGNYDGDSFSIYLNKDDKIYFSSRGNKEASSRTATGTIYPMF